MYSYPGIIMQPTNSSSCIADLDQVQKGEIKAEQVWHRFVPSLGFNYMVEFHWSFFKHGIQEQRVWLELTHRSLVNRNVYKSQSLISLDASKCNVFVQDSCWQFIVSWSIHVTNVLTRKKEKNFILSTSSCSILWQYYCKYYLFQ